MSSKSLDKKSVKIEFQEEEYFDLKHVVIPFSLVFLKNEKFIYDGSERIPFNKRDLLYKTILLQEFSHCLKSKGRGP